jgi:hypothetical protein
VNSSGLPWISGAFRATCSIVKYFGVLYSGLKKNVTKVTKYYIAHIDVVKRYRLFI